MESCSRATVHAPGTRANHREGGSRLGSTPGEGWAPPGSSAHDTLHEMTTNDNSIPDRSSPGSKRTAPPVAHQGRGDKCATDEGGNKALRARNNTVIGTWNVKTLRAVGKAEELAHEMNRYEWHVIGLCEVRLKNMGEVLTQEG